MKRSYILRSVIISLVFALTPAFAAKKADRPVNLKGFDDFVAKTIAEWKVPGVAVAVVKDGQVLMTKGYGLRDVGRSLPVTAQTIFPIGSSTKAFTAAGMAILVDEGKVGWDTPVRTYLPDFQLQDEYASAHATPRDLLCHRTGLARHELMWMGGQFDRQELFRRVRYLEMGREFRSAWGYQNLMFMTAGMIVGKAAGSSWEDLTRTRIFEPLGMKSSGFSVAENQAAADFSWPYMEIDGQVQQSPFREISAIGPAGSINSNALDMAQWVLLNLNKGKFGDKQIISEAATAQLHSSQMVFRPGEVGPIDTFPEVGGTTYGLGWIVSNYRGHAWIHHGGNVDGFTAFVTFLPKDGVGVAVLSNMQGTLVPEIIALNVYDRLLGLDQVPWSARLKDMMEKGRAEAEKHGKDVDKDRKTGTTPSHPLADYAGDYENPAYGTVSVLKDGDGLRMKTPVLEGLLSHYHYDVFELKARLLGNEMTFKVTFGLDIKGDVADLAAPFALERSVKDIVFTRAPGKAAPGDEADLRKFVGTYVLSGVEVVVDMRPGRGLVVTVPGQPDYDLVPMKGTEFGLKGLDGYSVEFIRDAAGAVTEIVFHQPNGTFSAKKK